MVEESKHKGIAVNCDLCNSENHETLFEFKDYKVFECKECKLAFTDPKIRLSEAGFYSCDYFQEKYSKRYDLKNKNKSVMNGFARKLQAIEKYADYVDGIALLCLSKGNLLDIGCATGRFLDVAKRSGWNVLGIDVSVSAVDFARKEFEVNAVAQDFLEFESEKKFDVITLHETIEHLVSPMKTLRKVNELLNPKGVLFIMTINRDSLLCSLGSLFYKLGFSFPAKRGFQKQHTFHLREKDLKKYLKKNGFEMVWVNRTDIPFEQLEESFFLKAVIAPIYFFQRLLRKPFLIEVIAKKRELQ